jgi:hypothetical protein
MAGLGIGLDLAVSTLDTFRNRYSLAFDGSNEVVDCGGDSEGHDFDLTDEITISCWMKTSGAVSTYENIVVKRNTNANAGWGLGFGNNGSWSPILYSGGWVTPYDIDNCDDQNWHHLVVSFKDSGDDTIIKGYTDGSASTSVTASGKQVTSQTAASFIIGGNGAGGSYNFTGNIDDVALWDAQLSDADVTKIYNSGVPIDLTLKASYDTDRTSNLKGYWRFETGSGSTAVDSSGNSHDGTLTNMESGDWSTDVPS